MENQPKVFISYSRRDIEWLERLRVHIRPLEKDYDIDVWDDTKITPGSNWREEIKSAIDSASVAVLLVSADFIASDFIAADELPPLLSAAENGGTVILPLILSPCRFTQTKSISKFQAINNASKPLINLSKGDQEGLFVQLSEEIERNIKLSSTMKTSFVGSPTRKVQATQDDDLPSVNADSQQLKKVLEPKTTPPHII